MALITATILSRFAPSFKVGLINPPSDNPEEKPEYYNLLPHIYFI